MPAPRFLPSDSTLQKWVEEGLTHQQIADRVLERTGVKVSRSSVSAALSRAGLTDRRRYDETLPWPNIQTRHNGHYAAQLLRIRARIDRGLPVTDEMRARLLSWERRLHEQHAVVVYVPDSPDGFYYVPAREGVDSGLIREPAVR